MTEVLRDWQPAHSDKFGKEPLLAKHNLHQHEMFTDAGIADMLDRYPRELFSIYTMNNDPRDGQRIFRRGSVGDLAGKEILEAINRGRLWLNLRNVNEHLPEYRALNDNMFGELEERVPSLKTLLTDTGFLISSPKARVFYHLDIPCVTLWQLRGTKTVRVYPTGAPYASDQQLEAIVSDESEEEITYSPSFDAACTSFELNPGDMLSWPQTAPHRVENGDCVNISLSCEYQTLPSIVMANAIYTNAVLRRKFGMNPEIARNGQITRFCKAALARVLKKTGPKKVFAAHRVPESFKVDLSEETGIRELSAA